MMEGRQVRQCLRAGRVSSEKRKQGGISDFRAKVPNKNIEVACRDEDSSPQLSIRIQKPYFYIYVSA
jgi:hypothetical protein